GYLDALKNGEVVANGKISFIRDNQNLCVADGKQGLGQVLMPEFLDILSKKVSEIGVVTGTMRNCGHIGRLGEWAENIAKRGFAGFVTVNDNGALQCVAPPDGKEACTSTNPIAFAIPTSDDEPFILDISTSAAAIGKIRLSHISGEDCAPYLIQDSKGKMTTNPAILFEEPKGALMPMGGEQGYKGFGISMFIDLLVAGLSGGFTPPAPEGTPLLNNVLVVMWNPESFSGLDHMQKQAQKYVQHVRNVSPKTPDKPVRIAGEKSRKEKNIRMKQGIPLSAGSCQQLAFKAKDLNIAVPQELISK
ncbi:MAG: Ldh family oxidoreductase, partial [Alphaproteobacteria bacterium]|nr:Ldh family oxidoreductase [Alphaproteobacteria bacterium]